MGSPGQVLEKAEVKFLRDLTEKSVNFSTLATSNVRFLIFLVNKINERNYSLSPGVWQSFVTIRSCNHLMRIISTYVDNTKKSEIS